jgi:hypothetical protein
MQELSIVFASDRQVLGEIITDGGVFVSMTLTTAGRESLSVHVEDWQVHGVPVIHDRLPMGPRAFELFDDRVLLRDSAFLNVLRTLLDIRQIMLVTLPPRGVSRWQEISAQQLTNQKRYKLVCEMCGQEIR